MTCFTPVRGRMARITRVNSCGKPICGPCSVVVTKGWISAEFSPQIDDGDDITVTNAAGETCVSVPAKRTMTGIDVTLTFCLVDTDAFAIMTGQDPITNPAGENIGFDFGDVSDDVGFALEIWTGVQSATACDGTTGQARYGYFVLPWVSSTALGDWTVENDAVNFVINGTARNNSGWGRGPFDVQDGAGGVAGPLDPPLDPRKFGRLIETTVAPPLDQCGCQELTGCDPTVESISVVPATATLPASATQQLTVIANQADGGVQDVTRTATYTSSDPAVATVDSNGVVTAVGGGTATITASYTPPGGGAALTDTSEITVTAAPVTSINVTPETATVAVGATQQLTVTTNTGTDVTATATYTSSDPAIATVDASGLVTGVAAGNATITASYTPAGGAAVTDTSVITVQ